MGLMGFVEQLIKVKLWSSSMPKLAHNFVDDQNDGKKTMITVGGNKSIQMPEMTVQPKPVLE